jgi:serine/threonine-protein kinase ATR
MVGKIVDTIPSLAHIPVMSQFEKELWKIKARMDVKHHLQAFARRCQAENAVVVTRALFELEIYLQKEQSFLHTESLSAQPDLVVAILIRSLLDACVRFSDMSSTIAIVCAKCLGLIGCVDHTKIEAVKETREIIVQSNFCRESEAIDFVIFFLQEVLVKSFLCATNARSQSFLGFAMQELLRFCKFDTTVTTRTRDIQPDYVYRKWVTLPESLRNTLAPFLTSNYVMTRLNPLPAQVYPLFKAEIRHGTWLRDFVFDLLRKASGENATVIFDACRRIARGQDIAISNFLLPYVALNVVLGGSEEEKMDTTNELLFVLSQKLPENNEQLRETIILCSQASQPSPTDRYLN